MTADLFVGVVAGVVASVVWLFGTRRVRPRVEIAPVIAQLPDEARHGRSAAYQIKVINRARRGAVDLCFELVLLRPARTKGGTVQVRRTIPLLGSTPLVLPGTRGKGDQDHNAYRLSTAVDLRQLLDEFPDACLRLRVMARDEVTGTGRLAERSYHEPRSDLQVGRYARGQAFEIV